PPHNLTQQTQVINNITVNNTQNNVVKNLNITQTQLVSAITPVNQAQNIKITNLATITGARGSPAPVKTIRLERVDQARLSQIQNVSKQRQVIAEKRGELEARALSDGKTPVRHTDAAHRLNLGAPGSGSPPTAAPPPRGQENRPPARGQEERP